MGTWGNKIKQDDFVSDVIDDFVTTLKQTQDLKQATEATLKCHAAELRDEDDGPLFWLGLAEVQWQFGCLEDRVLAKVKDDFAKQRGLGRWRDEGLKIFEERKREIEGFIRKVENPNPKPKKLPKITIRKPVFAAGDCLSISLGNGLFTAAIVLRSDESDPEYGQNLIGELDFLSSSEPTQADFERRNWLIRTHHNWKGESVISWIQAARFRNFKDAFKVVGKTIVRANDPHDSLVWKGWNLIGKQIIYQRECDTKNTQPTAGL